MGRVESTWEALGEGRLGWLVGGTRRAPSVAEGGRVDHKETGEHATATRLGSGWGKKGSVGAGNRRGRGRKTEQREQSAIRGCNLHFRTKPRKVHHNF